MEHLVPRQESHGTGASRTHLNTELSSFYVHQLRMRRTYGKSSISQYYSLMSSRRNRFLTGNDRVCHHEEKLWKGDYVYPRLSGGTSLFWAAKKNESRVFKGSLERQNLASTIFFYLRFRSHRAEWTAFFNNLLAVAKYNLAGRSSKAFSSLFILAVEWRQRSGDCICFCRPFHISYACMMIRKEIRWRNCSTGY